MYQDAIAKLQEMGPKLGHSAEWVSLFFNAAKLAPSKSPHHLAMDAPGLFPAGVTLLPESKTTPEHERLEWSGFGTERADEYDQHSWVTGTNPATSRPRIGALYCHQPAQLEPMRSQIEAWSAQRIGAVSVHAPSTSSRDSVWLVWLDTEPGVYQPTGNALAQLLLAQCEWYDDTKAKPHVTLFEIRKALSSCASFVAESLRSALACGLPLRSMRWPTAGLLRGDAYLDGNWHDPHAKPEDLAKVFWETMYDAFQDCGKLWRAEACADTQLQDLIMVIGMCATSRVDLGSSSVWGETRLFDNLMESFLRARKDGYGGEPLRALHPVTLTNKHVIRGHPSSVARRLAENHMDTLLHELSLDKAPCLRWPDVEFSDMGSGPGSGSGAGAARVWMSAMISFLIRELFVEKRYSFGNHEGRVRVLVDCKLDAIRPAALGVLLHVATGLGVAVDEARTLARAYWPAMAGIGAGARAKARSGKTMPEVFALLMLLPSQRRNELFGTMIREMRASAFASGFVSVPSAQTVYDEYHRGTSDAALFSLATVGKHLFRDCGCSAFSPAAPRDIAFTSARAREALVPDRGPDQWAAQEIIPWISVQHDNKDLCAPRDASKFEQRLRDALHALSPNECTDFAVALAGTFEHAKRGLQIRVQWKLKGVGAEAKELTSIAPFSSVLVIHMSAFRNAGITDPNDIVRRVIRETCERRFPKD